MCISERLVEHKIRTGRLPERICKDCGNTETFIATFQKFKSVLYKNNAWIDRAQAKIAYENYEQQPLENFSKEELKRFLDETSNDDVFEDFMEDLVDFRCFKCGSDKVLSSREIAKAIAKKR
jgi:hypothetical protein